MSADDDRFDPRFDPAFQRGYSGPAHSAPTAASSLRSAPPAARIEPAPAPRPVEHEYEQPARRVVHEDADDLDYLEDAPARRANPFLITLGVIAVLLLGGGLYLIAQMRDLYSSTQSQADFDWVTLQVLMVLAPIIVGLGIATAIGVLFVFAARWGSRGRR